MSEITPLSATIIKDVFPSLFGNIGIIADLDKAFTSGYGRITVQDTANIPEGVYGYGVALILTSSMFTVQIIFPDFTDHMLLRTYYSSAKRFSPWYKHSGVNLSSVVGGG
ncbi:MAG: hypothetical protein HDS16_04980 [Bacteroides sp.]|nr:hypothetical protein [Bacteroides sp.]